MTANANATGIFSWTPIEGLSSSSQPVAVAAPETTTNYTVTFTTPENCTASADITIFVISEEAVQPWLPNAFSPNGDGRNDVFRLLNEIEFEVQRFLVFNRWGEVVYNFHQQPFGWDGNYQLKPQPIGNYVYSFVGTRRSDGSPVERTGSLTLLR